MSDIERKKKPAGAPKPWDYLDWQGDQPTIDDLPSRSGEVERLTRQLEGAVGAFAEIARRLDGASGRSKESQRAIDDARLIAAKFAAAGGQ